MSRTNVAVEPRVAPGPPRRRRVSRGAVAVAVLGLFAIGAAVVVVMLSRGDSVTPELVETPAINFEDPANWYLIPVLYAYAEPGEGNEVVATVRLGEDLVEVEGTGRIAVVSGVIWREITLPGPVTGWVSEQYLTTARP